VGIKTPAQFKGKEAFYEKMLKMFVKDNLPETWASFDEAIKDVDNTKALVHKIKGIAGNLFIEEIHQCALQFEISLRNNEPDRDFYKMFVESCNAVRNSLLQ